MKIQPTIIKRTIKPLMPKYTLIFRITGICINVKGLGSMKEFHVS